MVVCVSIVKLRVENHLRHPVAQTVLAAVGLWVYCAGSGDAKWIKSEHSTRWLQHLSTICLMLSTAVKILVCANVFAQPSHSLVRPEYQSHSPHSGNPIQRCGHCYHLWRVQMNSWTILYPQLMMCLLVLACPRPFRRMSIIDNASWFSGFWHCWPHCWATRPGGGKWLWWVPAIADSISSLSAGIGARLSNISHKVTAYTSVRRTALYHDRSTQVYAAEMQNIKRELPKWRLLAVKTSKPKIAYSTTTYNKGPNWII